VEDGEEPVPSFYQFETSADLCGRISLLGCIPNSPRHRHSDSARCTIAFAAEGSMMYSLVGNEFGLPRGMARALDLCSEQCPNGA
jgi:hypothetical protein